MRNRSLMFAVIVSGLITGCSTTTTLHYDLKPATSAGSTQGAAMTRYQLTSIAVPESIDTASLVVRQPDNSLMVLSHDKWVAPLGEVLQNALSASLTDALGSPPLPGNMLAAAAQGKTPSVAQVSVELQRFDMQPAKEASLGALWQIHFPGAQGQVITCYSKLSQPVAPGVAALVAAQQSNVQTLGQEIAATLQSGMPPESTNGTNCQIDQP